MSLTAFDRMESVLKEKGMLSHPFYQAWSNGKLTREMMASYACQYYHFVKDFPRMVSAVHSNTMDISVRQELLMNLVEEEQGADNHPALWMRFANALGVNDDQVSGTMPLPTTVALVNTMMDGCRNGSFQEGLATLYAYEAQIPEVSRVKIEGLKKFYHIDDADAIRFFTVHQEADVYHSRSEKDMIQKHSVGGDEEKVYAAVNRTATALWTFLDGVHEEYVARRVDSC
jgi:pyrroloquinoline-quinone synthase